VTDQPLEPRLEDVEAETPVEDVETEEEPAEEKPAPQHDDAYLRLAADFDNYRKRIARDQAELVRRSNERLLSELLPVLDDLERALEAASQHEEAKLEEGVELVHRSLSALLARHGLTEIETEGTFDPHVHEAVTGSCGRPV
jgi:molecular chaperone GrpE